MKNLAHNALSRYHILLIVYSYILARRILYQGLLSVKKRSRTAMAEPLFTGRKYRSVTIILVNISTTVEQNKSHAEVLGYE